MTAQQGAALLEAVHEILTILRAQAAIGQPDPTLAAEIAGLEAAAKAKLWGADELADLLSCVYGNRERYRDCLRKLATGPRMSDRYRQAHPEAEDMFEVARV